MSVAEIKSQLKGMSPGELAEVKTFLDELTEPDEAAWLGEMDRRIDEMKSGRAVLLEEVQQRLGLSN